MIASRKQPRHRRERLLYVLGVAAALIGGAIAYVSYRADEGLPWQSSYRVTIEVPNANRLIENNDVRVGGVRVGRVADVSAVPGGPSERAGARVELALERSLPPLPDDTTVRIRSASVLGATFVDLELGESESAVADGGALPATAAGRTVELTDLFDLFESDTARSMRRAIDGVAGGLAGRGTAVNSAIGSISRLLPPLEGLSRTLAKPQTRLGEFLRAYESIAAELDPARAELGGVVSGAASTFDALARDRDALASAIEVLPEAEAAATRAFVELRPGLEGLAQLVDDLEPAGRLLPAALGEIDSTLSAGIKPLRQIPGFSGRLEEALSGLESLSLDPATEGSLRKLTELLPASARVVEPLKEAQVYCNVLALFGINMAGVFGSLGTGQGPTFLSFGFAQLGAEGEGLQNAAPSPDAGINPLPTNDRSECESGNEPWTGEQQLGNPPGRQPGLARETTPPPGVRELAERAGLLDDPEGLP